MTIVYTVNFIGIGVALGDHFCHVESAAVRDPTFWTFKVGMICNANI